MQPESSRRTSVTINPGSVGVRKLFVSPVPACGLQGPSGTPTASCPLQGAHRNRQSHARAFARNGARRTIAPEPLASSRPMAGSRRSRSSGPFDAERISHTDSRASSSAWSANSKASPSAWALAGDSHCILWRRSSSRSTTPVKPFNNVSCNRKFSRRLHRVGRDLHFDDDASC